MFTPKLLTTLAVCTLREASINLVFFNESTIKVRPLTFKLSSTLINSLVFPWSNFHSSTMIRLPSRNRSESAEHIALFLIFLGKLYDQSRGCGPCALPPPFHNGDRKLAMRARPVPFCFQSFRPEPETSPRVLVAEDRKSTRLNSSHS